MRLGVPPVRAMGRFFLSLAFGRTSSGHGYSGPRMLVTYFVLRTLSASSKPLNENNGPVRQAGPLVLPRVVTTIASSHASGLCPVLIKTKGPGWKTLHASDHHPL